MTIERAMSLDSGTPCAGQDPAVVSHQELQRHERRWPWALFASSTFAASLFAAFTGLAAWLLQKPAYEANAVLLVARSEDRLLSDSLPSDTQAYQEFDNYRQTQRQLLRSRYVMVPALRAEGLAQLPALKNEADPVAWLEENIRVTFPEDGELMRVSLSADDPQGLDLLVNSIVTSYFEQVVHVEHQRRAARLNDLELAHNRLTTQLRTRLTELKHLINIVGGGDQRTPTLEERSALRQMDVLIARLAEIQTELILKKTEFDQQQSTATVETSTKEQPEAVAPRVVRLKQEISLLVAQEEQVQKRLQQLSQTNRSGEGPSTDVELFQLDVAAMRDALQPLSAEIQRVRIELRSESQSGTRVRLVSRASPATLVYGTDRFPQPFKGLVKGRDLRVPLTISVTIATLLLTWPFFAWLMKRPAKTS